MAYTQRLPVRFDDVDYARIAFFPKLFEYCHRVFEDFFGQEAGVTYAELLQGRKVGFPSVHAEADFQHPLRFGDTCRVVMETVKLGTRSATHRYRLYLGDTETLCATFTLVTVAVDLELHRPLEIPPDVRGAFERHLVAGPEA